MTPDFDLLYAAFNARDIDTALVAMHRDVDWPNGWEGGRLHGREAVREYWTRQWAQVDSRVTPTATERLSDGRTALAVHQVGHDHGGNLMWDATVVHVYTTDADGLITRMDVTEAP